MIYTLDSFGASSWKECHTPEIEDVKMKETDGNLIEFLNSWSKEL